MAKRKKLTLTQRVERLERMAERQLMSSADMVDAQAMFDRITQINRQHLDSLLYASVPESVAPLPWYIRGSEYDRRRNGR